MCPHACWPHGHCGLDTFCAAARAASEQPPLGVAVRAPVTSPPPTVVRIPPCANSACPPSPRSSSFLPPVPPLHTLTPLAWPCRVWRGKHTHLHTISAPRPRHCHTTPSHTLFPRRHHSRPWLARQSFADPQPGTCAPQTTGKVSGKTIYETLRAAGDYLTIHPVSSTSIYMRSTFQTTACALPRRSL